MSLLQPGETIVLQARRHWFIIALEGAMFVGLALVPFVLLPAAAAIVPGVGALFAGPRVFAVTGFILHVWLLLLWMFFFVAWTNYYLDILIVTDRQVIDIEQFNLFARDQVIVPLQNIQDLKVEVVGLFPTILGFGDLHIQTASSLREVVVRGIRNPQEVKKVISTVYHAMAPPGEPEAAQALGEQTNTQLRI